MDNQDQPTKVLDLEVSPMEQITRAEVDVQVSTAHKFPRSLDRFYKRAEAMIASDEETAASCLYKLTRYDKKTKENKVIEGESIRMAEIVAACYGNLRSAVQISGYTPTRVNVRAVCHDLEVNNLIAVEKQAKTAYSDGSPYNEDLSIMIANATVSKALRDAIFRVVPKALVKPLKEKARQIAVGTLATLQARTAKALAWVDSLKVDRARVYAVLEVKGEADIGLDQLETLTGLRTAIKEGDQTVDEAFPPLDASTGPFEKPKDNPKTATKTEVKQEVKQETKSEPKPEPKQEPKSDAKTAPKPETAPVAAPVTKPEPAKTKAPPVVEPPVEQATEPAQATAETDAAQEQELAGMGLAPDQSEQIFQEELPVTVQLTEAQLQIKERFEAAGLSLDDLAGWGIGKIFNRDHLPKTWADIDKAKSDTLLKSIKGVIAGVADWKKKNQK